MTPKANKATSSYEKTPQSTKKHFLSLAEKLEIINLVEKGSKIATIAQDKNIPDSSVKIQKCFRKIV